MKPVNTILKILTALAAVAGAVYIIATYGEQIVAWCKKTLESFPKCPFCEADEEEEEIVEDVAEAEEAEPVAEEIPVEEVAVSDEEPVAEAADFAE